MQNAHEVRSVPIRSPWTCRYRSGGPSTATGGAPGSDHLGISSEMSNPVETRRDDLTTRPPAMAGQFYPTDPDRLRAEVSKLLAAAPRAAPSGRPKAIIAPHAGYRYSGQIAAAAFATLEDSAKSIERVVLIGPAHYVPFRGIAVPTVNAFVGRVPLDCHALVALAALPRVQAAVRAPG